MILGEIATVEVSGIPLWALVSAVLTLALAWWWFRERSARGVRRRAESSSKRAVAGIGLGISGALYAALGTARGLSGVLGVFGDFILEIPDVVAYFTTAAIGYQGLKGAIPLSAQGFALVAVVLFVLGVALDD